MTINEQLASELNLKLWQVEHAVELIDGGNTIPFIARYRKEATGELDDEALRALDERLAYLRNMEERKEDVKRIIAEQPAQSLRKLRIYTVRSDRREKPVLPSQKQKAFSHSLT